MSDQKRGADGFFSAANDAWSKALEPGDSFSQTTDERGHVEDIQHCDAPAVTHATRTPDGVEVKITGGSPQNETGAGPVARRLAVALRAATGVPWSADKEKPKGRENGTDWYLRHLDKELPVQVTRVGSKEMWLELGRSGAVTSKTSNDQMAREIARAIAAKRFKTDDRTILALDAGISGGAMFEPVIAEWRSKYTGAAAGMRVREIWLVGYSPETTFRLYPER